MNSDPISGEPGPFRCACACSRYIKDLQLVYCRPTGRITGDVMGDTLACMMCMQNPEIRRANRFHDLRWVTGVDLHFDDVKALVLREARLRQFLGTIKACYLVGNPAVYGIARMYEALITGRGVDAQVGTDIHELAGALGVPVDRLTPQDPPGPSQG